MFLAFTVVPHIMAEVSGAATESEMVVVITKAVFRLLKNIPKNNSQTSENCSIQWTASVV
jgi:hypothetical protein